MPDLFESYGIEDLIEDDEHYLKLQQYVTAKGKPIKGYYGTPYFYLPAGDTEFWEGTRRNEENKLEISEFHVHCCSQTIWKMIFTGIELTPKDWNKTERIFLMNSDTDEGGSIPVDIINADVIPSFLEGEKVDVQVVAPCLNVRYYATEEEYEADAPADKRGKKWTIATGSLLPVSFLANHLSDSSQKGKKPANDNLISFVAEVKELRVGGFQLDENSKIVPTFIRCVAKTQYGDLQFHHTYFQVPENMRDNIRVGAIITGTCILSADAVLGEYEDGIAKNAENNLRLVRYTLSEGEADRMRSVLTDQSVYETDDYEGIFHGPDEIVEQLKIFNENYKGKHKAYYAEVGEIDEPDTEYPIGTKCLVLVNEEEDEDIESIVFVDTDKDGNISRIKVSTDDRYTLRVHRPEPRKSFLDDIEIEPPNSVAYLVMMRAIIIGFLNSGTKLIHIENNPDRTAHETYAKIMLDALQEDKQEDVVQALRNIMGYLFAKAVETEINQGRVDSEEGNTREIVYEPYDAIRGILNTKLEPEIQERLIDDMGDAQRFVKDVFSYMERTNKTDDDFVDVFVQAATAAQRIGKIYADKVYLDLPEEECNVEYEIAELYKQAYSTGIFDTLYDCFTDDYSHISFWVTEPIQGKQNAINYYTGKGNALRHGKDKTSGRLVEITNAPDRVRPKGLFRNGVRIEENPVFLNRNDTGKIAVLIEQETEKELVQVLAIPTVNEDGTCSQLLIANPDFYSWKELEQ